MGIRQRLDAYLSRYSRAMQFALLGFALVLAIALLSLKDFHQPRIEEWTEHPMPRPTPLKYVVTIETIDEETGLVKATAQLELETIKMGLLKEHFQAELGQFPESVWQYNKIKFWYGPLVLQDLGENFSILNMLAFAFPAKPKLLPPLKPTQEFSDKKPVSVTTELSLLGDPKLFPFDRYMFLGEVYCNVVGTLDGQKFALIRQDYYSIRSREPAFVLRPPSSIELANWPSLPPKIAPASEFRPDWSNRFALIAERPLFVRVLAVFLFLVALCSTFAITFFEKRQRLLLDSAGYFLSLWAMRSVLAAWGPTSPTLVDYVILGLYAVYVALLILRFAVRERRTA